MITTKAALLHLTHYDPLWYKNKDKETKPDIEFFLRFIDLMGEKEFDTLILDCADGVEYKSHPELKRQYTITQDELKEIKNKADQNNIDVVPKLNFSRSHYHTHNVWFRPYNKLFDTEEYWKHGFQLIDELISLLQPKQYFHIGMDEDHDRSVRLYVEAVKTLHTYLSGKNLQTIIWNDSAIGHPQGEVFVEKINKAVSSIPKDIVQVVWDYAKVSLDKVQLLLERDFPVWIAPANKKELITGWMRECADCEIGMLFTYWMPYSDENKKQYFEKFSMFADTVNEK